ncbi:sugar transferase [Neptunitalea lumnitzerae]|uniref:Sugar transferase n=1 Tax=Neptunitalea lumnitzerae TaxID=2965509 RepID=A0ABQ5MN54_9FLAO|nr:sugar transferase [Neptunitalea sp. Y10]GLB50833.1 sugar transferase [Neptunitalea sp. Y10]
MSSLDKIKKRLFDIVVSLLAIIILLIPILFLIIIATFDTTKFGLFFQERIGKGGKVFYIFKIRTLKNTGAKPSNFGSFLRGWKLDELPQFFNVFLSQMSVVGPRPDLVGFADELKGGDKMVLNVKPGLTSRASLKYFNEEEILKRQKNPVFYNESVIWPDKVKLNRLYVQNWTFKEDLKILLDTLLLIIKKNNAKNRGA